MSLEEHPVNHSQSLDSEKEWKIQEEILPSHFVQFLISLDPSGSFGKTCQVSSVVTKDEILVHSSGRWAELGYGASYRVLDAQNFGVPQRRRRVFVVGHLGDWKPTAEVLFESESLRWHPKKSREARKDSPGYIEGGFGAYNKSDVGGTTKASGGVLGGGSETFIAVDVYNQAIDGDVAATVTSAVGGANTSGPKVLENKPVTQVFENHPADSRVKEMGDTCHSVTARWGTGGGNIPFVLTKNFYDVVQEVAVRKYDVDINRLQQLLKKHKNMSIKDIAEKIGVKKTTAEHWFRTDKFFAVPEPEVWPVVERAIRNYR